LGEITLIDLDEICVTNINRQIHSLNNTVGKSKIAIMGERLKEINPELRLNLIEDFITPENVSEYIDERFDFVVDAIDSLKSKLALILHCKRHKIPFIVTGAAGGRKDPTQIAISDLNHTIEDKLLFRIRKKLRREHNFSREKNKRYRIPTVFSSEQIIKPKDNCQNGIACDSTLGSAVTVTSTFGMIAASYVLNQLARKSNEL
jgi:tRNA A37 threonylcarbamoyladenosine dehydratase